MHDDQMFPSNEEEAVFSQDQELAIELSDDDLESVHGSLLNIVTGLLSSLLGGP